ncbi:MAG: tryptophan--tRNA ligase [Pseudomonadota bacterium]
MVLDSNMGSKMSSSAVFNTDRMYAVSNISNISNVANISNTRVLTGDRPTGKLHLGHYAGSLSKRLELQQVHEVFIMIADMQAMSCYFNNPKNLKNYKLDLMRDYYSVGLGKSIVFMQSDISAISVLGNIFMNLISLNKVMHNPTLKTEIAEKKEVSLGFIAHPVLQAADILSIKANVVPVGEDQKPLIELANDIIKKFNSLYQKNYFNEIQALVPKVGGRLSGIYGKQKASKSLNNAIYLSDNMDDVRKKVFSMYTDANHILKTDPGQVEGNVVFEYLTIFGEDQLKVEAMKKHYAKGGLGDMEVKRYLFSELEKFLIPIQNRRDKLVDNDLLNDLYKNNKYVNTLANEVLQEVLKLVF